MCQVPRTGRATEVLPRILVTTCDSVGCACGRLTSKPLKRHDGHA